jgi:very-short-patch-repair endonuclease
MGPRLAPEARALLRLQRGLIADWQSAEVGLSRRTLLRATGNGWEQHGLRVFSDRAGDLSAAQLRLAGLLEAGPGALLTGCSALIESGWSGSGDHVDVLVPRSSRGLRRTRLPWLRLHHRERLPDPMGVPARAPGAVAVVDACTWARTSREVLMIVVSSAQQGLTSARGLHREVNGRQRLPHRRWILEALRALSDGAQSTHEADFLRECRRRGLPKPRMQTRRIDALGGRRRTDAEFHLPDGRLVIVEIDGVGHLAVDTWHADLARHNALTVRTGALTMRVTGWEVRNNPDPFFALLTPLVLGEDHCVIDPAIKVLDR